MTREKMCLCPAIEVECKTGSDQNIDPTEEKKPTDSG